MRKRRLEELLRLAQTYRAWNRKQLAKALGRDPSNLVPDSGTPKIDLVVRLAQALDWPVQDVIAELWDEDTNGATNGAVETFDSLNEAAKLAHREGRYDDMLQSAERMLTKAETAEQRALASNRELGAWDGIGRYRRVLEAAQRGLQEPGVSRDTRLKTQVNLATAYYSLWQLVEAQATAHVLVEWFDHHPPADRVNRITQAFAHYVRGHSRRRLITVEPESTQHYALQAKADLETAIRHFDSLAADFDDQYYLGISNTCRGGILEVQAVLGERDAESVMAEFTGTLENLCQDALPVGDWLESYGWWCIFGCNVALRHLTDEKELQRCMSLFTRKADEIAAELGNWSMRERVFSMELARRQRFSDWTGVETEWTIDSEDVRLITGTMGRIPSFQRTGWEILRSAKVVREN